MVGDALFLREVVVADQRVECFQLSLSFDGFTGFFVSGGARLGIEAFVHQLYRERLGLLGVDFPTNLATAAFFEGTVQERVALNGEQGSHTPLKVLRKSQDLCLCTSHRQAPNKSRTYNYTSM